MSTPTDFAVAAQKLAATLLDSVTDPADALRLLASLAVFTPTPLPSNAPLGQSIAAMQNAAGDLFRRAAVVAMARASTSYQPASQDDAVAVRDQVCALLDAEIVHAADQGSDATYAALRALRIAVIQDLDARGAKLPAIVTIKTSNPLPALALAQRLYRDPGRADELTMQADSIHPAFMPVRFKALGD